MSEIRQNDRSRAPESPMETAPVETAPEEALVRKLIEAAGRGVTASPAARERVHAAAEAAWRRSVAQRRAHRRYAWLAAAGVVLAIAATLASFRPGADRSSTQTAASPGARLGTVAKLEGPVYLVRAGETRRLQLRGSGGGSSGSSSGSSASRDSSGNRGSSASRDSRGNRGGTDNDVVDDVDDVDDFVRLGDTLRTGAGGRAALMLAGGLSVRVNKGTALTFRSREEAVIEHGAVYVDAGLPGERSALEPLELVTRFGSVSHLGTQYEVNVEDADLRVRVREGSVAIERGDRRIVGESGEQLTVPESGAPVRKAIETHGESWAWIDGLAAVEARDPYPVLSLLQWASRQTGRRLEFESSAVEARARALMLHGVEGLTPEEALDVVRATTALGCTVRGDALYVTAADAANPPQGVR